MLAGCTEVGSPPSTLFVTDYRANAIVRYDGTTGTLIDVFAQGASARVDRPASVRRGPNNQLYSAGFGRGDVVRYDLASGAMMDVFFYDTNLLEEPVELVFRGGNLLVLGNDTENVVELDPVGRVVRSFGYPTMRGAQDFVVGPNDQLFVATESHPQLGSAIQVWDLATGTLARQFAGYDEIAFASGLAFGDDALYVCDFERSRVVRFDPATGESLGVLIDDTVLDRPARVDIGPDGALYVLDAVGLHRFDRETGAYLGRVISVADGILQRPLSFTFVVDD